MGLIKILLTNFGFIEPEFSSEKERLDYCCDELWKNRIIIKRKFNIIIQ